MAVSYSGETAAHWKNTAAANNILSESYRITVKISIECEIKKKNPSLLKDLMSRLYEKLMMSLENVHSVIMLCL